MTQRSHPYSQEQTSSEPLFPSQRAELRAMRLPDGMAALHSEAGPNPENENSAVFVQYQVRVPIRSNSEAITTAATLSCEAPPRPP